MLHWSDRRRSAGNRHVNFTSNDPERTPPLDDVPWAAALVATRVVAPRLRPPVIVPGPPKRFAQAIGLVVTGGATVAWAMGADGVVTALLAVIATAALLESAFAFCLGCWAFARLMRIGVVPRSVCERCVVAAD